MDKKFLLLVAFICLLASVKANDTLKVSSSIVDTVTVKTEVFDPEIATQKYLDTLTPAEKEKSDAYFEGGYWLMLWNIIYDFVIVWIFLSLGLSQWVKRIALKAKNVNIQNLIYISLYLFIVYLMTFPLNIYQAFFREHQYNLSNLTFGGWFGQEMIGLALSLVLGSLVLMLLYIAIRKVKETWWIWGSGIAIAFMIFGMIIAPVFIMPLFNNYKPLEEGVLKNEILSIARANGVSAKNVYQFDASKQSKRISANVNGFGSTIRVSLNDNLLNRCTPAEVKAVMAHELGHYVMNHIYKLLLMIALVLFLGFAFVNWAFKWSIRRWGNKWQLAGISDIAGFPLLIFLFTLFSFFATPIQNNISRITEVEADYFGYNAAQEPDAFASIAMKLSEYRKINPGRLEEILFFDHPSGRTRVYNAMVWKAEHLDKK